MLFVAGIPTFFLETAVGQFSGLSPSHAFANMVPLFQGLGYAAIIINAFIGFYYNVIIAYCLYYFIFSINSKLPWSDCKDIKNNITFCFKCNYTIITDFNCTQQKNDFALNNNILSNSNFFSVFF